LRLLPAVVLSLQLVVVVLVLVLVLMLAVLLSVLLALLVVESTLRVAATAWTQQQQQQLAASRWRCCRLLAPRARLAALPASLCCCSHASWQQARGCGGLGSKRRCTGRLAPGHERGPRSTQRQRPRRQPAAKAAPATEAPAASGAPAP
jgi:type II secretory pathway pseudopilin PulG